MGHRNLHPTITVEEKKIDINNDLWLDDEDTLAWLDANYGGHDISKMISPKASPLQRFRRASTMLVSEIRECRKYGYDANKIDGAGYSRSRNSKNVNKNSPICIASTALASDKVMNALDFCWDLTDFDIFAFSRISSVRAQYDRFGFAFCFHRRVGARCW